MAGSLVMGKDGLGSDGPPHPSERSLATDGAGRPGVSRADSPVMASTGSFCWVKGLPRGPMVGNFIKSIVFRFRAPVHWILSRTLGSWLNLWGDPVARA